MGSRFHGIKFDEEILPDVDPELEILESLERTQLSNVSRRLRGILGSANLAEIRFRGTKVEQQLHWQSGGERKIKRHLATLNDAVTDGGLKTVASTPPTLERAVDELESLAATNDTDSLLDSYTTVLNTTKTTPAVDPDLVRRSLSALLRHRKFAEIVELCSRLNLSYDYDPLVAHYNAQAHIELDDPASAIKLLREARDEISDRIDALEALPASAAAHKRITLRRAGSEVENLLGRAYIQQFIDVVVSEDAQQTELGRQAEKYFHDIYHTDPS